MLNECPQEFTDSIMKPPRSNHPSSDTIYHGTVIPYVKGISEKFRHIGNHFNVRTIFETKHTFCGTLMKTGPMSSRRSGVCTIFHVIVADVTPAKQADL
jgi:hypothetical protein